MAAYRRIRMMTENRQQSVFLHTKEQVKALSGETLIPSRLTALCSVADLIKEQPPTDGCSVFTMIT